MRAQGISDVINTDEIDALTKEIDIDPIAMAAEWFDDGTRLYFSAGAVVYVLSEIKHKLRSRLFKNVFGDVWNFVDSIGGYVIAASEEQKLVDAKGNVEAKKSAIAVMENMSTLSLFTTGATALAQTGFVHGMAATILSPMASFGFAAGMWAYFGLSVKKLNSAIDKTNMAYLANDCLVKYNNVGEKIKLLNDIIDLKKSGGDIFVLRDFYNKLDSQKQESAKVYLNENSATLENKINELSRIRLRLKNQALAIYRVNKSHDNFIYEYKPLIGEKVTYDSSYIKDKLNKIGLTDTELEKQPTEDEKSLVDYLHFKGENRVTMSAVEMAGWGLAAIGMALIACAYFFPPLAILGTALVVAAGIVKISCLIVEHINQRDKMNVYAKDIMKGEDAKAKIANLKTLDVFKGKDYSDEKLFSYRAAFELSVKDKIVDKKYEEAFYEKIEGMFIINKKLYLDNAKEAYISRQLISEGMGKFILESTSKKDHKILATDYTFFKKPIKKETPSGETPEIQEKHKPKR